MPSSYLLLLATYTLTHTFSHEFVLDDNFDYIENSNIRLGIDLSRGGAIGYLSAASNNINVVNIADMGREIQLSFYAGPNPFCASWNNSPWPWNPIGAGDVHGNTGKILSMSKNAENTSIHIITQPLQWPCDNVKCECTFERYIELKGQRVDVMAILHNNRSDHKDYGEYNQELPAVYSIGTLYKLYTYNGSKPWTNDTLVRYSTYPNTPWTPVAFPATENWAAMINDENWGMGVVNFGSDRFLGGFAGTPDQGGATDENTGYIAPTDRVDLKWDITYTYNFSVVLGYLEDIRKIVYSMHDEMTSEL